MSRRGGWTQLRESGREARGVSGARRRLREARAACGARTWAHEARGTRHRAEGVRAAGCVPSRRSVESITFLLIKDVRASS
jgi:hypothetical protein